MGQDKAAMLLGGRPLAAHMLDKLRAAGLAGRVAGAPIADFPAELYVPDAEAGSGPLSGVTTALIHSRAPLVLVLGTDLPLLSPCLLCALLERARITHALATIPRALGRSQPLCAIYRAELATAMAQQLAAGTRKLMLAVEQAAAQAGGAVDLFDVEALVAAGSLALDRPVLWEFLNCYTPAELALAERLFESTPTESAQPDAGRAAML